MNRFVLLVLCIFTATIVPAKADQTDLCNLEAGLQADEQKALAAISSEPNPIRKKELNENLQNLKTQNQKTVANFFEAEWIRNGTLVSKFDRGFDDYVGNVLRFINEGTGYALAIQLICPNNVTLVFYTNVRPMDARDLRFGNPFSDLNLLQGSLSSINTNRTVVISGQIQALPEGEAQRGLRRYGVRLTSIVGK